jgi:predicted nucleic acid-binding Zn ribbon protein
MKDTAIAVCPECGGTVKRLLYPVGIVFKGSGWYVNDSRKPEKSETPDTGSESKPADKSGEKAADKPAESAPAAGSGDSAKTESPASKAAADK